MLLFIEEEKLVVDLPDLELRKDKGKVVRVRVMKAGRGSGDIVILLTLALDGGECSLSLLGCLNPGDSAQDTH
jgi:hypothetical protein